MASSLRKPKLGTKRKWRNSARILPTAKSLHKAQVKELTTHLAKTEAAHKAQVKELTTHLAKTEKQYKAQIEEISAHLAKTEADHKAQVEDLITRYDNEIEQLRQRIVEMNGLLHQRSVNLAEDEKLHRGIDGPVAQTAAQYQTTLAPPR